MRPFSCALFWVVLFTSPVWSQFKGGGGGPRPGPGPVNPGGNPGVRPNPGVPNPGFPNPGMPKGGQNPGFPQPGFPQPGVPNRPAPGVPFNPIAGGPNVGRPQMPAPVSPFQVRNPISTGLRIVPASVPIQITNPHIPSFSGVKSPEFQRAHDFARTGNAAELSAFVQNQMKANNGNLNGMFTAVNALHGVNNPAVTDLRASTLSMAQRQIAQGVNQPMPWVVVAQMSLQDRDAAKFNEATQALVRNFPNSEYTPFFQGIQQLENRDFRGAQQSLERARALGMPEESIADMLRVAIDNQKWIWEYALVLLIVVALWLMGLFGLFLAGKHFSKRTLDRLHSDPDEVMAGDVRLRTWYRRVIAIAGAYYYLSLPMVLLVAIALPLTLGYAMLMVPYLNLILLIVVLVLGLAGIVTAISGVRAAFLRVKPIDEGRVVTDQELPGLWALATETAEKVGTRRVDEIRVTWGSDLCVFEAGSWRERRNDTGKRTLVLGLGVLSGLKRDALKSILAHEYGHFQNRDTAGGEIALRVNLAMRNFADAILRRGKILWWDVAVQFLIFYHFIFRRLTFGASRLQEVLADRVAVQLYGAAALREGLTHVIRRSVELEWSINKSLDNLVKSGRPAVSFFDASPLPELREREEIETAVRAILDRPTDAEDSHPSPKDRFRLAERLDPKASPLSKDYIWSLFTQNPGIVDEMSQKVGDMLDRDSKEILSDVDEGVRVLTSVIDRYDDMTARIERARLYMTTAKYEEALKDFNKILDDVPDATPLRIMRAHVLKRLNRLDAAILDLEKIARPPTPGHSDFQFHDRDLSDDDKGAILLTLAECRAANNDPAGAISAYTAALRRQKTSLVALIGRGKAHAATGAHAAALSDLDCAAQHWPETPEIHIERQMLTQQASQGAPSMSVSG